MDEKITNFDMFEQFYEDCRELPIQEVVKKYSSWSVYVPSYKGTYRNEKILHDYIDGMSVPDIARKYELSPKQIYEITYDIRNPKLDI
jgi:Mor family transcriptional regulator